MNGESNYKRHWSFVVTDKKYLYPVVVILSIAGLAAALHWEEPTYFSRIGGFIIGVGVWMSMRYTLREGINKHKDALKSSPTLPGPRPARQLNLAFFNEIAFSIGDARLQLHGFFIVIYGSSLSAFGDLLIKYILSKC